MKTDSGAVPTISIILPVYNGLPYLEECVQSVLKQSYQEWELLISDDGSTDGTLDWLRALNDQRIRVFEQETNLGIFGNLNFLFKQARAPLACHLGQDDYLFDDALSRVVEEWALQPPEIGFIRFNWIDRHVGRKALASLVLRSIPATVDPADSDLYFFLFGCFMGNFSNVSVRTQLVGRCGGFRLDLPFAGDLEFWSRLARNSSFYLSSKEVAYVRSHPGQAMYQLNKKGELVDQLRRIVADLYGRLAGRIPSFLLNVHATLAYDSLQRDIGLKMLLFGGDYTYLSRVNSAARNNPALFGLMGCWFLYFLSTGGRIGRALSARLILRAARLRNPAGARQS